VGLKFISAVRYDTINYYSDAPKSRIRHTKPRKNKQKIMKRTKNKNRNAQKKWSGNEDRGVSFEVGRESMMGKDL